MHSHRLYECLLSEGIMVYCCDWGNMQTRPLGASYYQPAGAALLHFLPVTWLVFPIRTRCRGEAEASVSVCLVVLLIQTTSHWWGLVDLCSFLCLEAKTLYRFHIRFRGFVTYTTIRLTGLFLLAEDEEEWRQLNLKNGNRREFVSKRSQTKENFLSFFWLVPWGSPQQAWDWHPESTGSVTGFSHIHKLPNNEPLTWLSTC